MEELKTIVDDLMKYLGWRKKAAGTYAIFTSPPDEAGNTITYHMPAKGAEGSQMYLKCLYTTPGISITF